MSRWPGDVGRAALPVLATVLPAFAIIAILSTAGSTLGYDYEAYVRAARRVLDGLPLYDRSVDLAGGFAVFLYPPPFALAFIPFALLPASVGQWLWIALLVAAFVAGVAILPVSRDVRWLVLLIGGIDWPVLYGLKLGQVSALVFLLFAIAWRWRDRAIPFGLAGAVGTLVKLQPALLFVWALLTGRLRSLAIGVVVGLALASVATVAVGPAAWFDYLALLGRVTAPVTTPHNFTPGAVAFQLGAGEATATVIQGISMVATLVVVLAAIHWATEEASLLVTFVASQLLSPLLWDHYAIVLLLPVAYLIARGHWWAVLVPLVTALPIVGFAPPAAYPICFGVCLVAPLLVGLRRRELDVTPAASWAR
jgi:hypothetical protein